MKDKKIIAGFIAIIGIILIVVYGFKTGNYSPKDIVQAKNFGWFLLIIGSVWFLKLLRRGS
jgi:hypothetical protein